MNDYRVGQRLMRIEWDNGQPNIKVGTISKVTSRSYYVNNYKKPFGGWYSVDRTDEMFDDEYRWLMGGVTTAFDKYDINSSRKKHPPEVIVKAICRLRRLHRKVRRK